MRVYTFIQSFIFFKAVYAGSQVARSSGTGAESYCPTDALLATQESLVQQNWLERPSG